MLVEGGLPTLGSEVDGAPYDRVINATTINAERVPRRSVSV